MVSEGMEMAAKRDGSATEKEPFSVEKGVLHANTDLYWNYLEAFDAACARVLASKRLTIEIDLTDVNFISSSFLGCLNNVVLQAGRLKKQVTLKVSQDVSWLFEIMGSRRNLDMRVL